jgi:RNA polymerase sigma-70 factor (ECF subfamily)
MVSVESGARATRYKKLSRRTLCDVASGEHALVQRLQNGDEAAFVEVVENYHPRLLRFAAGLVGSWAAAEDVVQDTWVAVIRGVERFEGRSSLQTWLFQICANRARSAWTKQQRTVPIDTSEPTVDPSRFGSDSAWVQPPEPWDAVDDRLLADAVVPLVRTAIEDLPDMQRQVVTLRDVEGLTSADVCDVLAISEGNQRVLLHRGRARVRRALEQKLEGQA